MVQYYGQDDVESTLDMVFEIKLKGISNEPLNLFLHSAIVQCGLILGV